MIFQGSRWPAVESFCCVTTKVVCRQKDIVLCIEWLVMKINTDREKVPKSAGEFCANTAVDNLHHLVPVVGVNLEGQLVDHIQGILQSFDIASDDDCGVEVVIQEWLSHV